MRRVLTAHEQVELLAPWRTAAADEDYGLPPNMEFRLYDGPGMYGLNAAGIWHKNKPTKGGNWVSALTWKNGEIGNVETKERHKGNGYAGMLYNWVKDNHEPNLQHSRSLTPEGKAWAEKVGRYSMAMEENMVTVYTKPGCPQCTATERHLTKKGIPHEVIDVTADPEAHHHVTHNLGYAGAPVVYAGEDNHWSGFRPDRIEGLLE